MGVRFFFDEGLGQNLAHGLELIGKNVEHVLDNFPAGTEDTVWLEYVGINKFAVVTKDKNIRKNPKEKAALLKYGVVAFYLGGSEKSGHDIAKQLFIAWEKMEMLAAKRLKSGKASAFIVRPRGGKIVEISLI